MAIFITDTNARTLEYRLPSVSMELSRFHYTDVLLDFPVQPADPTLLPAI
jgi:hypothetical protein